MTKKTINLREFERSDRIGESPLGETFQLKSKTDDLVYVIKILKNKLDKKGDKKLSHEVKTISQLAFPSLTRFLGLYQMKHDDIKTSSIISEKVSLLSLQKVLQSIKDEKTDYNLDDTSKLIIIYGIANSLSFLHSHDVVHCNLKAENVLLDDNYYPYVTDYALSKTIHKKLNKKSVESTNEIHGSVFFFPPEFFKKFEYTKQVDVYAFAMIAYQILTGKKPFDGKDFSYVVKKVSKGSRPKLDNVPEAYKNLIEKCWDQSAKNRPSFEKIVKQLRTDSAFITESVDKEKYFDYVENFAKSRSDKKQENAKLKKAKSEVIKAPENEEPRAELKRVKSENLKGEDKKDKNKKHKKTDTDEEDKKGDKDKKDKNKKSKKSDADEEDKKGDKDKKDKNKKHRKSTDSDDVKEESEKTKSTDTNSEKEKEESEKSKSINTNSENEKEESEKSKSINTNSEDENVEETKDEDEKKEDIEEEEEEKSSNDIGLKLSKAKSESALKDKNTEDKGIKVKKVGSAQISEKKLKLDRQISILLGIDKNNDDNEEEENDKKGNNKENTKNNKKKEEKLSFSESLNKIVIEDENEEDKEIKEQEIMKIDDKKRIANERIAKLETAYADQQENEEYEYMFQTAKEIYDCATEAFYLNTESNEKFKNKQLSAIQMMGDAAEHCAPLTKGKYGIILSEVVDVDDTNLTSCLSIKPICINKPDYEKFEKYVKIAGLIQKDQNCIHKYILLFEQGKISSDDYETLAIFYEKESEYETMVELGNIKKSKQYLKTAIDYYRKAARQNKPYSIYKFGQMVENGFIPGVDRSKAIIYYKKAAALNQPDSICIIAKSIENNPNKSRTDEDTIKNLYEKAANLNHPEAMFRYAQIIEERSMVRPDRMKSLKYYQKAADMNHPASSFRLAQILEEGSLVMSNRSKALEYYKRAADSHELEYVIHYASLIKDGSLGRIDLKEAADYFKFAADNGDKEAMFDYAVIRQNGKDALQDKSEAALYYQKAAALGHTKAQHNYDLMLKNGEIAKAENNSKE